MAEVLTELILITSFEKIFQQLRSNLKIKKTKMMPVAMFDLAGSTRIKLEEGHSVGTRLVIEHNLLCEDISEKFGGTVIKHMGDGIFLQFQDAIEACRARARTRLYTACVNVNSRASYARRWANSARTSKIN